MNVNKVGCSLHLSDEPFGLYLYYNLIRGSRHRFDIQEHKERVMGIRFCEVRNRHVKTVLW